MLEALIVEDPAMGDGFSSIAVCNLARRLVVEVDHRRFGDIGDGETALHRALGPVHVLQAGQQFVVRLRCPDLAPDGGVGVVAERVVLAGDAPLREPLRQDLMFRELGRVVTNLPTVRQRRSRIGQWGDESLDPRVVHRKDVGAGDHQNLTRRRAAADIERSTEREDRLVDGVHLDTTGERDCRRSRPWTLSRRG